VWHRAVDGHADASLDAHDRDKVPGEGVEIILDGLAYKKYWLLALMYDSKFGKSDRIFIQSRLDVSRVDM